MMNAEHLIMGALGIACTVLGWLARELWAAVQALRVDLTKLEVKLSSDFVRYDRLQDALRPLMDALDEIRKTLSHKVDR
jgi:hypothetical protein